MNIILQVNCVNTGIFCNRCDVSYILYIILESKVWPSLKINHYYGGSC